VPPFFSFFSPTKCLPPLPRIPVFFSFPSVFSVLVFLAYPPTPMRRTQLFLVDVSSPRFNSAPLGPSPKAAAAGTYSVAPHPIGIIFLFFLSILSHLPPAPTHNFVFLSGASCPGCPFGLEGSGGCGQASRSGAVCFLCFCFFTFHPFLSRTEANFVLVHLFFFFLFLSFSFFSLFKAFVFWDVPPLFGPVRFLSQPLVPFGRPPGNCQIFGFFSASF